MSYYEHNVPPTREQRLSIGNAFSGKACGLLKCAKEGCLLSKQRSFQQSTSCQMGLTLQMVGTIPGSAILMHGPVGCGSQLHGIDPPVRRGLATRGKTPAPLLWFSTNLEETDVIGGGERKLREAIEDIDRHYRPDIIFIVSTCAPNIIGDDVDEVVRLKQPEVSARLVPLHCPGFKTRVVATAYDTFYHALIRHIDFAGEGDIDKLGSELNPEHELKRLKYLQEKSITVNLINASSIGEPDERELSRLLKALGLNVNVYAEFASLEEFGRFSRAALNVSMCNVHDDYLLEFMKQKFNIPYVIHNMPVGLEATAGWLVEIAKHFGLEEKARLLIAAEERRVKEAVKPFLPKLKGKRVLIGGGVVRVASEALMLKELGMEVAGLRAYHYDNMAEPVIESFNKSFPDVPVSVAAGQIFEFVSIIKRENPDIVVAHAGTNGWIAKTGVPSIPLYDVNNSFFGYRGYYDLVRRLALALSNTSYQRRLAGNVRLPYHSDWYARDPFSYIKG